MNVMFYFYIYINKIFVHIFMSFYYTNFTVFIFIKTFSRLQQNKRTGDLVTSMTCSDPDEDEVFTWELRKSLDEPHSAPFAVESDGKVVLTSHAEDLEVKQTLITCKRRSIVKKLSSTVTNCIFSFINLHGLLREEMLV